jgi:hypothetical protein
MPSSQPAPAAHFGTSHCLNACQLSQSFLQDVHAPLILIILQLHAPQQGRQAHAAAAAAAPGQLSLGRLSLAMPAGAASAGFLDFPAWRLHCLLLLLLLPLLLLPLRLRHWQQ